MFVARRIIAFVDVQEVAGLVVWPSALSSDQPFIDPKSHF
jgi:hypothetical protein